MHTSLKTGRIDKAELPSMLLGDAANAEMLVQSSQCMNGNRAIDCALSNLPGRVAAALGRDGLSGIQDLAHQLKGYICRVEVHSVASASESALFQVNSFRDVLPACTVVDDDVVKIYLPENFLKKVSAFSPHDSNLMIESALLESLRGLIGGEGRRNDVESLFKSIFDHLPWSSSDRKERYDSTPYETFIANECSTALRSAVREEMRFALIAIHCAPAFPHAVRTVDSIHNLLALPNLTACYENVYLPPPEGMGNTLMPVNGSILSHWGLRETQRYHGLGHSDAYLPSAVDLNNEHRFILTGGHAALWVGSARNMSMSGACLHRAFCNLLKRMDQLNRPFEIHLPFGGPIYHGNQEAGHIHFNKDVVAPFIGSLASKGTRGTETDAHILIQRTDVNHGTQTVYLWKDLESFKEYSRCPV